MVLNQLTGKLKIVCKEGKTESAAEHKPEYLRVSQAERERAERLKQEKHE